MSNKKLLLHLFSTVKTTKPKSSRNQKAKTSKVVPKQKRKNELENKAKGKKKTTKRSVPEASCKSPSLFRGKSPVLADLKIKKSNFSPILGKGKRVAKTECPTARGDSEEGNQTLVDILAVFNSYNHN